MKNISINYSNGSIKTIKQIVDNNVEVFIIRIIIGLIKNSTVDIPLIELTGIK